MEGVEHGRLHQPLNAEHVVDDEEDELAVRDQVAQTDPVVLEFECDLPEVALLSLFIEKH